MVHTLSLSLILFEGEGFVYRVGDDCWRVAGFDGLLTIHAPSLSLPLFEGESARGREGAWTPPIGM